jgi:hypothetical protein
MKLTHQQHTILEDIQERISVRKTGLEDNFELYRILYKNGYLRVCLLSKGRNPWKFSLTDKGREYLKQNK